eukprot:g3897.t1
MNWLIKSEPSPKVTLLSLPLDQFKEIINGPHNVLIIFISGLLAGALLCYYTQSLPFFTKTSLDEDNGTSILSNISSASPSSDLAGKSSGRSRRSKTPLRLARSADNPALRVLLDEQLSRGILFFGEKGQKRIEESYVIVVGLGGVGSHAAHMLARSGVGKLRLIDFDHVTLSSLNRHAVATRDDVGRSKVAVCRDHFADIIPSCHVEAVRKLFNKDTANDLDVFGDIPNTTSEENSLNDDSSFPSARPDYVIDCIDDVETKADLLEACASKGLRVISAMGAGAKSDPTRVVIAKLHAETTNAPLLRQLRFTLRKRHLLRIGATLLPEEEKFIHEMKGNNSSTKGQQQKQSNAKSRKRQRKRDPVWFDNVDIIYSSQRPVAKLKELDEDQKDDPSQWGAMPHMRVRTLPVFGAIPAVFGMTAACQILCNLSRTISCDAQECEPVAHSYVQDQYQRLLAREAKHFDNPEPLRIHAQGRKYKQKQKKVDGTTEKDEGMNSSEQIGTPVCSRDDVRFVIEEIWKKKSSNSFQRKRLCLTRFDRGKPALLDNLVLLTYNEADRHDSWTKAITEGKNPDELGIKALFTTKQHEQTQKRLEKFSSHLVKKT